MTLNPKHRDDRTLTMSGATRTGAGGFTLIEMLVVVAVILLLISILVPGLMLAQRYVEEKSTEQWMAAISMGAKVYAQDFDDLPPSEAPGSGTLFGLNAGTMSNWSGGEMLTQALLGTHANDDLGTGNPDVRGLTYQTRTGPSRVYVEVTDELSIDDGPEAKVFVDRWDTAIYYYKAIRGRSSVWGANGRFDSDHNASLGGSPNLGGHPEIDASALRSASFVLFSRGIDLQAGTEDDIVVFGE